MDKIDPAEAEKTDRLIGVWVKRPLWDRIERARGGMTRPELIRQVLEENLEK